MSKDQTTATFTCNYECKGLRTSGVCLWNNPWQVKFSATDEFKRRFGRRQGDVVFSRSGSCKWPGEGKCRAKLTAIAQS